MRKGEIRDQQPIHACHPTALENTCDVTQMQATEWQKRTKLWATGVYTCVNLHVIVCVNCSTVIYVFMPQVLLLAR
jgi:hypothetical protein